MKIILFIVLLNIPLIGFGQSWTQQFGGFDRDYGSSVQQTSDGGYIIVGSSYNELNINNPNSDIYLIKTDVSGNELWTKRFGEQLGNMFDHDDGHSVQQTSDGGYIIVGRTNSFSNDFNVYLIKTDGNGDSTWTKTFGGTSYDDGYSVQQTSDSGYIIAGLGDYHLIKTDINGNSLWTKTFADGEVKCVQQTADGGYILAGMRYSSTSANGGTDIYLLKTDGNGNELWNKSFGGPDDDIGYSVQQTTDGGYIVVGSIEYSNLSYCNVYLIKTDGNGNELWNKTFGGVINSYGYSAKQTTDGGFIIAGKTRIQRVSSEDYDVYLIKTDGNGNEIWNKNIGTIYDDVGSSVQQTNDGGYIITGSKGYFSDPTDVYLIKTDGNGNVSSIFNIPPSSKRKLKKTVNILGKEIISDQNNLFIEIYDDGSSEKKLIIEN